MYMSVEPYIAHDEAPDSLFLVGKIVVVLRADDRGDKARGLKDKLWEGEGGQHALRYKGVAKE